MHVVRQEQWVEWKSHPVTLALKEAINQRILEATDQIVSGPSNDRDFDQFMKGMVRAFNEVLVAEPEIILDDSQEIKDELSARDTGPSGNSQTTY